METFISNNLKETESIASEIAKRLKNGGFLALYGGMGAGKTAFVRGLIKELCPECLDLVHSPTFAIVNEYRGQNINVFHFDLYRLEDGAESLDAIGFEEYVESGHCILEWSEYLSEKPDNAMTVDIRKSSEDTRTITIDF